MIARRAHGPGPHQLLKGASLAAAQEFQFRRQCDGPPLPAAIIPIAGPAFWEEKGAKWEEKLVDKVSVLIGKMEV